MNHDLTIPANLIAERMGLSYPKDRWPDLAQGIAKAAVTLDCDSEAFLAKIVSGVLDREAIEALASHLTVPETHFFRSPDTFAALQTHILPELIAAQKDNSRRLRLWSAGCATGPEPYSLAILVTRLLPERADWDIDIIATDINPAAFAAARKAEYTQWAFRGTPDWVMNGYFTKTRDGRYRLSPAIQEMVTFRYLNLVQDEYPTDCDLILCRNVIMYFSRETAVQVSKRIQRSLKQNGYLLVTASETSRDIQGDLSSLTLQGEIVYKKSPPEEKPADNRSDNARETEAQGRSKKKIPRVGARAKTDRIHAAQLRPKRTATKPGPSHRGELRIERRAYSREPAPPTSSPDPEKAKARADEARLLADRGDLHDALAHCEAALECDKMNPSLYYLKASILQELSLPEAAEHALQSTLFLDDGFALARVMLGAIARSQDRAGEAAKHFREALTLLQQLPADSVLEETNGLTVGEMVETVESLIESERVS